MATRRSRRSGRWLRSGPRVCRTGWRRPVALEPVDPAFDRVPGFVVLVVEGRRPPAGLPAAFAVGGLVGRLRDRAADSALSKAGPVGAGRIRHVAPHPQRTDTGTARSGAGHPDGIQDGGELRTVTTLTSGDQQGQRPLPLLAGQVDLRGEASPGPAQAMVLGFGAVPPGGSFWAWPSRRAPAAC